MKEIKRCKYLLPCGYCDKYDIPCKASKKDLANYYNIPLAEETEDICNHDWRFECSIINEAGCAERHRCAKCGETKTFEVIGT